MRRRNGASRSNTRILSANATASPGETRNPVSPSVTISGIPPVPAPHHRCSQEQRLHHDQAEGLRQDRWMCQHVDHSEEGWDVVAPACVISMNSTAHTPAPVPQARPCTRVRGRRGCHRLSRSAPQGPRAYDSSRFNEDVKPLPPLKPCYHTRRQGRGSGCRARAGSAVPSRRREATRVDARVDNLHALRPRTHPADRLEAGPGVCVKPVDRNERGQTVHELARGYRVLEPRPFDRGPECCQPSVHVSHGHVGADYVDPLLLQKTADRQDRLHGAPQETEASP